MKNYNAKRTVFNVWAVIIFLLFAGIIYGCKDMNPGEAKWAFWGGNIHNTHFAENETIINTSNVHELTPKWEIRTDGNVTAIPTVSETRVYFVDYGLPMLGLGSSLYAVDRENGRIIYKKPAINYSKSIANNIMRTSPAIYENILIVGDLINQAVAGAGLPGGKGGAVYGIDRSDGKLLWKTTLDDHPFAIITQSPVVYKDRVYVGVSSLEEAAARLNYDCCSFIGSFASLDAKTGEIIWQTPMIQDVPENEGFTGNAVWGSSPAIDEIKNVVYIATGNNYTFPQGLRDCLDEYSGDPESQDQFCYSEYNSPTNHSESILALDLDTGTIKWSKKMNDHDAWTFACSPDLIPWIPANEENCHDLDADDFDFGQAPMLFSVKIHGKMKRVVGAGQKSGVFWLLDPDKNGELIWAQKVGPGGILGGMEFGSATDGTRIYVQIANYEHTEYELVAGSHAGEIVNGGLWAALDPATGEILWQTPDPSSFLPLEGDINHLVWGKGLGPGFFGTVKGPLTIANGVLFGGSMDIEGHMYALNAETGEILWSFESGGSVMSAPAVVDGTLYWGSGHYDGFYNNRFYAFEIPK